MNNAGLLIAAGMLTLATPATAQTVAAAEPQSVVKAMQSEGYQAKLDKDEDGDPMIRSSASGSTFEIYFYDCEEHQNCESVMFSSGYDAEAGSEPSLERINEWNNSKRYAMAALDKEGDPWLSMDVYAGEDGISQKVFAAQLALWAKQMGEFEKHIGWGD